MGESSEVLFGVVWSGLVWSGLVWRCTGCCVRVAQKIARVQRGVQILQAHGFRGESRDTSCECAPSFLPM
jgi:hypothetical protein